MGSPETYTLVIPMPDLHIFLVLIFILYYIIIRLYIFIYFSPGLYTPTPLFHDYSMMMAMIRQDGMF